MLLDLSYKHCNNTHSIKMHIAEIFEQNNKLYVLMYTISYVICRFLKTHFIFF